MVDKETMNKEMEVLLAEREVTVNDKKIIVKRYSLLDTIRLAAHASSIVASVIQDSDKTASAITKLTFEGNNPTENNSIRMLGLVELLSIVGEDGVYLLKELLVKSTNLDEDEVEEIDLVDGIDLVFAMYEVNKGFFTKFMKKLEGKIPKKKRATKKEKSE